MEAGWIHVHTFHSPCETHTHTQLPLSSGLTQRPGRCSSGYVTTEPLATSFPVTQDRVKTHPGEGGRLTCCDGRWWSDDLRTRSSGSCEGEPRGMRLWFRSSFSWRPGRERRQREGGAAEGGREEATVNLGMLLFKTALLPPAAELLDAALNTEQWLAASKRTACSRAYGGLWGYVNRICIENQKNRFKLNQLMFSFKTVFGCLPFPSTAEQQWSSLISILWFSLLGGHIKLLNEMTLESNVLQVCLSNCQSQLDILFF